MRISRITMVAGIVPVLLLVGCLFQDPLGTHDAEVAGHMPRDSANDTMRSYSAAFAYETLLPVDVVLSFMDSDSQPVEGVVATIAASGGAVVLRGRSDAEGNLVATALLPSAPQDLKLTAEHFAHETRSVTIRNMVRYSVIERVMQLPTRPGSVSTASVQDSDGDGVPDTLDDFPNDPKRAFRRKIPAENTITVAFEDLFPAYDPDDPSQFFDADFNDFVANYAVEEIYNADNLLVELRGEAEAVARVAGYNHRFGMLFGFEGTASLTVRYYSSSGSPINELSISEELVSQAADITLFHNTRDEVGRTTAFILSFTDPLPRDKVTAAPYDPYLHVRNTGFDIHLIGREPLPYSDNPMETYRWAFRHPANGMPWALLVPTDWRYPGEMQHIEDVYPAFRHWRESFGEHYPDWYLYYEQLPDPPSAPPPVVATLQPRPKPINWELDIKVYTYQLGPAGSADDTLYYRTREDDLPAWIVLDEATGVVTVDSGEVELDYGESVTQQLSFYSSYNASKGDDADDGSTWDEPLVRTFEIYRAGI